MGGYAHEGVRRTRARANQDTRRAKLVPRKSGNLPASATPQSTRCTLPRKTTEQDSPQTRIGTIARPIPGPHVRSTESLESCQHACAVCKAGIGNLPLRNARSNHSALGSRRAWNALTTRWRPTNTAPDIAITTAVRITKFHASNRHTTVVQNPTPNPARALSPATHQTIGARSLSSPRRPSANAIAIPIKPPRLLKVSVSGRPNAISNPTIPTQAAAHAPIKATSLRSRFRYDRSTTCRSTWTSSQVADQSGCPCLDARYQPWHAAPPWSSYPEGVASTTRGRFVQAAASPPLGQAAMAGAIWLFIVARTRRSRTYRSVRARLWPSTNARYDGTWLAALTPPRPCGLDERRPNALERAGSDP